MPIMPGQSAKFVGSHLNQGIKDGPPDARAEELLAETDAALVAEAEQRRESNQDPEVAQELAALESQVRSWHVY